MGGPHEGHTAFGEQQDAVEQLVDLRAGVDFMKPFRPKFTDNLIGTNLYL
jgi:hypothetical protein